MKNKISPKISIVGCGQVGMATASSLFQQGFLNELVLIDIDSKKSCGEALDLMHAQAYASRTNVVSGEMKDVSNSDIVILCAGVSQKKGETRLDLVQRNKDIFKNLIIQIDEYSPDSIIIVATNPVDILTYFSQTISKRHHSKIIGTGTLLDTSRFRSLIGNYYGVNPKSVHAFIVGEHGDSEVAIWSSANVAGKSVVRDEINSKTMSLKEMEEIAYKTKHAAYEIIENKGYTNWAIGLMLVHLVSAILKDTKTILPLSVRLEGLYGLENVCLGMPAIIGRDGIESVITPSLNENELEKLIESAKLLQSFN